jgi:hypothetical protein
VKASKSVIAQRIRQILDLRLNGAELADILHYASSPANGEPPWGVTERQIQTYVARADALCSEVFDAQSKHLLSRHLLQRRRLYLRAMAQGDYRLAVLVLQDEAKLENLYPAEDQKPGVNVNVTNQVTAITAEEIAEIVNRADAQRKGLPLPHRVSELPNGSSGMSEP